jgi:O-antigen ligase
LAYWLFFAHLATIWSISASNILLGLAIAILPWALKQAPFADWPAVASLTRSLGLYVLLLVAAIVASVDWRTSIGALREIFNLATVVLAILLVRSEKGIRRLIDMLIGVAALLACAGLAQYLVGYGDLDRRIRGPFSHYMTFSGFLLVADLLLIASLLAGGRVKSVWRWAALAVINIALLGSLTRGAWVGLGVTLTLLAAIKAPRWLLAWIPAAALFIIVAPTPIVHRAASIFDLRDFSNYDRLCMMDAGLRMIAERPLFGLGPEMVERRYPLYRDPTAPRYSIPHLHNTPLQMAAERGLPALAAYFALLGCSLWRAWRLYRTERRWADLALGVLLAIVAFTVAGLFEDNWGDTEVRRPLLFLLAVPFCLTVAGRSRSGRS